jgi:hypothetical protein
MYILIFFLKNLQNHQVSRRSQSAVKSSKLDDYSQFNDDKNCSSITQQQLFQHIEEEDEDITSKMSQDCGSTCAKYILCAFNFVFFVSRDAMTPTIIFSNYSIIFFLSLQSPIYIDSRISRAWAWPLAVIRQKLDSSTTKNRE